MGKNSPVFHRNSCPQTLAPPRRVGRPRAYLWPRRSGRRDPPGRAHALGASKTVRSSRRGGVKRRSDSRPDGPSVYGAFGSPRARPTRRARCPGRAGRISRAFLSVSTWYARPTRFPSPTPTRSPRGLKGSEVAAYMIPDLVHDAIRARTARICQRRRFGSESDSHRSARFWARRRTSRASTRGPRGRPRVRRGSRRACRRTPSAPTCPCDVSAVEKPTSLTRSAASPFMSAPTTPTTYRAPGGPRARL